MKSLIFVLIAIGLSSSAFGWGTYTVKKAKAANLFIAMNMIAKTPEATTCANNSCTIQIAGSWCTRTWHPDTKVADYDCTLTAGNKEVHATDKSAEQYYNTYLHSVGTIQCKFDKCAFRNELMACTKQGEGKDLNKDYVCKVTYYR